ncbi:MAG TPA: DUF6048 family protein [Cyclobacteriaceae bacterium]|nr:DUF6048 family protein [Cyclobacteriaceae bacterium]
MKFSGSIILILLVSLISSAQVIPDTVQSFKPTGIRVGTDLLVLGKSFYKEGFYGWEVNGDIDFNKYLFAIDIGGSGREFYPLETGLYSNNGVYFRLGADINFLQNDPQGNMLMLGIRYGRSVFNENLQITAIDDFWGEQFFDLNNTNTRGRWMELTTGLRVKIFKYFMLGYTGRFKFFPKSTAEGELIAYEIPGYGIKDLNIYWGFNYQLFFNIPLKSQK